MNLTVIIPVGPGHENASQRAMHSVDIAKAYANGRVWNTVTICVIPDLAGTVGRSASRNKGIRYHGELGPKSDWLFLLDADDTMTLEALTIDMPLREDALFGPAYALYWPRHREKKPVKHLTVEPPLNWQDLMRQGPIQSYMMGNFYRTEALQGHLFREDLDFGEDWEHHLSFLAKHDWQVSHLPLALADNTTPSAEGPRGGSTNWKKVSEPFFEFWRKRGRVPLSDQERATKYWT